MTENGEIKQTVKKAQGMYNPVGKRLFTLKEGAQYLGRSEYSMRELIWAGEIPAVKREGGRKIFLDILDLDNWVIKNKSRHL